jgi:hypothetical protein
VKDKQVVRIGRSEVRVENGRAFVDGKEVTNGNVVVTANGKEIRVENGRITIDGKEVGAGENKVHVTSIDSGDGTRREEVRVQVIRAGDRRSPSRCRPPPPVPARSRRCPRGRHAAAAAHARVQTLRFESTAGLGKGTTTTLGLKDFDGVKAEGKSTVWTIAPGEIGNKNAIRITSESWYSPDLKVTVYSRYHDPRTGESIFRLAGIRRAEPARDLFTVPPDYQTRERGKREERK